MEHEPEVPAGYNCLWRTPAGGYVYLHDTHGKQELRQNLPIALFLAERGEQVCLLRVLNEEGAKNPDATRNGVEWEFKVPESLTRNAVDKALRNASKQADRVLLQIDSLMELRDLEQALYDRVRRVANLLEIAVLRQKQLYHFDRQEITNNTFRGKIK